MAESARRRVLFVTGTRADFGKLEPLAAEAHKLGHDVTFFITGMHMLRQYGETRLEVRTFDGATFYEYINHSPGDTQVTIISKTMLGFSDWVEEHRPDLVVVHGDRVEALGAALVCSMRYIPVAHVEGGEISASIDEVYRHCITKLCRYHFVSSTAAAGRVRSLGEPADDIFVIGSPELDRHAVDSDIAMSAVRSRYDIAFDEYGIAIFHPVTSEHESLAAQAASLFGVLERSGRNFVVILPNNDPGSELLLPIIDALPCDQFRILPSMRFGYFSTLLKNAALVVGNSSLGVREAPFLGVPSLDVGSRQMNRSQSESITTVDALDALAVARALETAWGRRYARHSAFGDGKSAERFGRIISSDAFWSRPSQKQFVDLDDQKSR